MNMDLDGWEKYGLPGIEMVELRNKMQSLLRQALDKKGVDGENAIYVLAGCNIFIVTLTDPLAVQHLVEIEKLIQNNIAADHSYELRFKRKTGQT